MESALLRSLLDRPGHLECCDLWVIDPKVMPSNVKLPTLPVFTGENKGTWSASGRVEGTGLLYLFGPSPDQAADPRDSEYVCSGESGRADRQGGTQRWLFSSMRSRLRGPPSQEAVFACRNRARARASPSTPDPRDALSTGRCCGVSGSRMGCRAHSRSCRPAKRAQDGAGPSPLEG